MEFYNKVQVLDPFTSKSTVESSLMDMARHAMLVTHICSIRQLQIDLPGDLIDPNCQGGRLESGSDAHVCRLF